MPVPETAIWIGACAGFIILITVILLLVRRRRRVLKLDGQDFEEFCASLLEKNGFDHVELTPASGDFGADILARKDGISFAFQCKYYEKPVGTRAVQEIYSGRDYYGCMVGVVMTNSDYTKNAVRMAEALNILLWDGVNLSELYEKR